jgi:membrane protein YdbS with pleckstrin-like domain
MAKSKVSDGASQKDKEHFKRYLAEDEELVVASGYGKNYIRHRFAYYIILPGIIFILVPTIYQYFKYKDSIDGGLQQTGYGMLFGLILACIVAFIKSVHLYHSHRYLLTTRRVIIKNGFFAVKLITALYDKITHIEVDQSLMDRMVMKHGNIIINTAGGNKDEIKLLYIDNPIEFKNMLERLINREREQVGRGTGPVVTVEGEVIEE